MRTRHAFHEDAQVLSVLVSDREELGSGADVHVGRVAIVGLEDVRRIARLTIAALTRVRARGQDADDGALRARILTEFTEPNLLPSDDRAARSLTARGPRLAHYDAEASRYGF